MYTIIIGVIIIIITIIYNNITVGIPKSSSVVPTFCTEIYRKLNLQRYSVDNYVDTQLPVLVFAITISADIVTRRGVYARRQYANGSECIYLHPAGGLANTRTKNRRRFSNSKLFTAENVRSKRIWS